MSESGKPSEIVWARVVLPAPAGPSIVITLVSPHLAFALEMKLTSSLVGFT